jgi:hypothetical protein
VVWSLKGYQSSKWNELLWEKSSIRICPGPGKRLCKNYKNKSCCKETTMKSSRRMSALRRAVCTGVAAWRVLWQESCEGRRGGAFLPADFVGMSFSLSHLLNDKVHACSLVLEYWMCPATRSRYKCWFCSLPWCQVNGLSALCRLVYIHRGLHMCPWCLQSCRSSLPVGIWRFSFMTDQQTL